MMRNIKAMEPKYLTPSLQLVETVFSEWDSPDEGKMVRSLVEEIRVKKYYIPELEFIMVDEADEVIGYAMFSRFPLEGKHADELLILTPVAVKPEYQRQGIGTQILTHILEKNKGRRVYLQTFRDNPARKLYERVGFQKYGETQTHWLMERGRLIS